MQIIPITDLRDTNKITEMCYATNEPLFITKNGYGPMVIMSMKTYNEEQDEKLLPARLASAQQGNVIDADTALQEIKTKYGL